MVGVSGSRRSGLFLAAIVSLAPFFGAPAIAQLTTGVISGTVTDPSGAAVPGVSIGIKNVETGIGRTAVSGPNGRYEAANLPVGKYEVSATLAGFQTTVRSGIELAVGRTAVVDLSLQVGEVTQAVTVTGEAPLVETTSATVSNLVDEKRVTDLPLNGRDLNQLAFLQPGVLKSPEQSDFTSGQGDKLIVNGARGYQNLFLLDGVNNSDYMGSAAGASGTYTGAESIKEFQIVTNNYSAQYQSAAGAIISAVTKSGTNSLHGSAFEYLRNDKLDAANYFDNAFGNPKPSFKRNQFGGSMGGPVLKDRTFFFGSYEGYRERLARTATARVPSIDARRGVLPGRTVVVNPAIVPYLNLLPVPGVGARLVTDYGDGTAQVAGSAREPTNDDYASVRIDHQLSTGLAGSLSGTYNYDTSEDSPFNLLLGAEGEANRKHTVAVQHTGVFSSTTLNEFKFGYSIAQTDGNLPLVPGNQDLSSLAVIPGRKVIGQFQAAEITSFGWRHAGQTAKQTTLTFNEGLSFMRGNHSLRTGIQINRFHYDYENRSNGYNGDWTFRSLDDFLRGIPQTFSTYVPGRDDVTRDVKQLLFGAYLQDNYTVSPSLTLTLGLRYEFVTVPAEAHGKVAALVNFQDVNTTPGKFMTNPTLKSFSPRFGFAWAPGSRKTSVRGGYGIFYDLPKLAQVRSGLDTAPPFTESAQITDTVANAAGTPILFPNAYTANRALFAGGRTLTSFQYNQKNSYTYRWNVMIQRQVGSNWAVSAGYTGSRALHLWVQELPNLNRWEGFPNQPTGRKFFPVVRGENRINPNWGSIRMQMPQGNSYYHGLLLGAQKRLTHGFQFQVSYTYSKNIDQGATLTGGSFATDNQRQIYTYDQNLMRSLSSQDIRNSFSANITYEPTMGQNWKGPAGVLARGWQINTILTLTSGYPLTIIDSNRAQTDRIAENTGLRVNLKPGGNNNPVRGGPNLYYDPGQFDPSEIGYFGTLGRNTLISPGIATVDWSLLKDFRFTEKHRLQFRAEFFNLFNRVNLGAPDTTPYTSAGRPDANAGRIADTRTKAREIQFALKYLF